MKRVTFADLRTSLTDHLDRVEHDGSGLIVSRPGREDLVILPRIEWDGLRETVHLLGTAANARRLHESIAELEAGRGIARDPIEP